jgi:hypothetical protein
LIQFFLRVMHPDMLGGSTTFCAEPLSRTRIPSEIRVFHFLNLSGPGIVNPV